MNIKDTNNNPNLIRLWMDNEKSAAEQYYKENPDSLIPLFEKELRDLGFEFEISNQIQSIIRKNKKSLLPIVVTLFGMITL